MLLAVRGVVAIEHAVPVRIGVNRGPVFAGEIGPTYRRTYTVMGDAVNLAARLMTKAEVGQILATQDVLQGSRTLFSTTELEPFLVKGKKEPVHASAVGEARESRVDCRVRPAAHRTRCRLRSARRGVGLGLLQLRPPRRDLQPTREWQDPPARGLSHGG
jgi:hypothetical protein